MKAISYAGIGLFSVASVYGVADYYMSSKNGSLDNLYKEEEPIQALGKTPIITPFEETTEVVVPDVKTVVVKKNAGDIVKSIEKKKRRKFSFDDFSRARIPEEIIEIPAEDLATKTIEPKATADEAAIVEKPVELAVPEGPRKLGLRMFSRAPLKKKLIKKVNAPVVAKTDEAKQEEIKQ